MQESSLVFYGLALGVLIFSILSTTLPDSKFATASLGLAIGFTLGLFYAISHNLPALLVLGLTAAMLLVSLVIRLPRLPSSAGESPPQRLLVWIILGSFLLILAVVFKDTPWRPVAMADPPALQRVWSDYKILLYFIGAFFLTGILWLRPQSRD